MESVLSASGHQESSITEATRDTKEIGKGMDNSHIGEGKNGQALSLQINYMHSNIHTSTKLLAETKGLSITSALLVNTNPKVYLSIGFSAKHMKRSFFWAAKM